MKPHHTDPYYFTKADAQKIIEGIKDFFKRRNIKQPTLKDIISIETRATRRKRK